MSAAITIGSLIFAAVTVRGWRKARRETEDFRLLYFTALSIVRETQPRI
jgi:hypothetical protein